MERIPGRHCPFCVKMTKGLSLVSIQGFYACTRRCTMWEMFHVLIRPWEDMIGNISPVASKECVSFTSRRQSRLCLVFNRGFDHLLSVSQEACCLISLMILKLPPYSDKDLYSFYLKSLFGIFMKIYLVICYCSSLHWHPWYKWISIFGSHTVEFPSLLEKHRYFWKSYPRLCSYKYTFYILH